LRPSAVSLAQPGRPHAPGSSLTPHWSSHQPCRLLNLAGPTRCVRSSRIIGRLVVAADVDAPASETGCEAGVLPLLADRKRQLEVGHGDPRGALAGRDDLDLAHLSRRQGAGHKFGWVVRPVDDVDLLAAQL